MKVYLLRVLLVSLVVLAFSCTEQVELPSDQGYDFFPLDVGQSRLYTVDEVIFTGSAPDSSSYFLREDIVDTLANASETTYLIYRYIAEDTTAAWSLDSVWTVRRNSVRAVVTENNIPLIKLTFPVREGIEWDGNALNAREPSTSYYEQLSGINLNGMSFASEDLIRVVIADVTANLVEQDERNEHYARGIGLIQKDYISASFCQPGSGCEEVGIIDEGRVLFQSLIKYEEE